MAKILLVEDDTNLSEIYQARMEAEGYEVVSAADGESALAIAAKERPDLIISDVMMPKISGFEMLDILRNTTGLKDTPVIMLTALGQADDKTRADQLGANRYLVKSQVTLEDIVNAAHALLEDNGNAAPLPQSVSDAVNGNSNNQAEVQLAVEAEPVEEPVSEPEEQPAEEQAEEPAPEAPAEEPAPKEPEVVHEPVHEAPATADRGEVSSYERRPVAPVEVPSAAPAEVETEPAPAEEPTPEPAPADDTPTDEPAEPVEEPASEPEEKPEETPVEAPAATNPAPATDEPVINDEIVAGTVDKLLKKSPKQESKNGLDPKKVISPLDKPSTPSLKELLAKEEAENGPIDADDPNDIAL